MFLNFHLVLQVNIKIKRNSFCKKLFLLSCRKVISKVNKYKVFHFKKYSKRIHVLLKLQLCYELLKSFLNNIFKKHQYFLKFYDYYDFPIQKFTNQISLSVEMI